MVVVRERFGASEREEEGGEGVPFGFGEEGNVGLGIEGAISRN